MPLCTTATTPSDVVLSRPKSWSRGASRTKNKSLGLGLETQSLGLEVKVLVCGFCLDKKSLENFPDFYGFD